LQKETDSFFFVLAKSKKGEESVGRDHNEPSFQIPESGLTIHGLIEGLKKGSSEIHGAILSNLMKALEEQLIEHMVQKDPGRYRRNGYQSKPRHLRCSLGTIPYRFAQLIDQQEKRPIGGERP
jgi:hypothetical protein